jgi:hypothetical protein
LQEVKKGINIFDGEQAGLFPASQLSRRYAKDSEYVLSMIAFHYWPCNATYRTRYMGIIANVVNK